MIGAIVARIYYKILTIDHVFMIECAAIYSLSLYVTVDRSVFLFKHLNKVLCDRKIDTDRVFQSVLRTVRIRAIVGV